MNSYINNNRVFLLMSEYMKPISDANNIRGTYDYGIIVLSIRNISPRYLQYIQKINKKLIILLNSQGFIKSYLTKLTNYLNRRNIITKKNITIIKYIY